MESLLGQIDQRALSLSLAGVSLALTLILTVFLLWPQFKAYGASKNELYTLNGLISNEASMQDELTRLESELLAMQRSLKGDMANRDEKEMEAHVIGVLQEISWDNDVDLIAVAPNQGNKVHMFQEVIFQVKLAGDYFDLHDWFMHLRSKLGFIVVKKLSLQPITHSKLPLQMDLTIASYRTVSSLQ